MSEDYPVGYGRPPREHRFKPGNQAAGKRNGQGKGKALSLPDIVDRALRTKRRIKRGDQVITLPVAEIMVERLIQAMVNGSAQDLTRIVAMLERYMPDTLAAETERLEVTYHRVDSSNVDLPPADLWDAEKP